MNSKLIKLMAKKLFYIFSKTCISYKPYLIISYKFCNYNL